VLFGICAPDESVDELELELDLELDAESESLLILFSINPSGTGGTAFGEFSKNDG